MPISYLKQAAQQDLNGQYRFFVPSCLFYFFAPLVATSVFSYLLPGDSLYENAIYYCASFLIQLLMYLVYAGLQLMHMNRSIGQPISFSLLFTYFKNNTNNFLMAGFIFTLVSYLPTIPLSIFTNEMLDLIYADEFNYSQVIFTEITVLFLCCLILIVGIMMDLVYGLTFFLLVENPTQGGLEAMKKSRKLMRGHKADLFVLNLSFIGYVIIGIITFGIFFLWLYPYMIQTKVRFYKHEIKRQPM